MAEIVLGDIVARLRADASQLNQALQDAARRLQQLQQVQGQARQQQTQGQQATHQLTQALHQLTQALQHQTRAAQESTRAAQQFGSAWRQALTIAGGIGITTSLQQVATSFKNLLTESVSLSARMQDLHVAFRAIEGGSGAANRTLGSLFETAQRLGIDFLKITDGFKRMEQAAKASGIPLEDMRKTFEGVLQGSRTLGLSSENVSRALVALEQILTKNRAGAEELNQQLGDAVPGGLAIIARALGRTTAEFQEMVQLGIIPAQTAVVAFGKGMAEIAGSTALDGVERMTSVFAQLKNETTAWMTALGDSVNTTLQPFLRDLVKISEELRRIFSIRPPGQHTPPGSSQPGFLGRLFPGLLTPTPGGFMPGNPYMPSEFEGAQARSLGFASSQYDALIRAQAARIQFDETIFSRLIQAESNFNARAFGPMVPGQGRAVGLGQIMPQTAAGYGVTSLTDLVNPEKNLELSANVLRDYRKILQDKFGTLADETRIVLAAYNAGIGNVIKAIIETQRVGEAVSFEQVIGRLPQPGQTGPYVERITGQPTYPAPALPAGAAGASTLDPFAPIRKTVEDTLASLSSIQTRMDFIAQSGLNVGGILNDALTKQADEAIKKFTQVATMFAAFPQQLEQLTPVQREQLQLAAQQVVAIQHRLSLEAQTEGDARRRIQELAQIEALQERLNEEQAREAQRLATTTIQGYRELGREEDALIESQRRLADSYQTSKLARDADTAAMTNARLATTQYANESARWNQIIQDSTAILEDVPDLRRQAAASAFRFEQSRELTEGLESRLDQLRTPRAFDLPGDTEFRAREQAKRQGIELQRHQEELLANITAYERLGLVMDLTGRIGESAASALTDGLLGIVDGTQKVGEAFKQMAKSILDSVGQLLVSEGFRLLLNLGLRALSGAVMGGLGGAATGALGGGTSLAGGGGAGLAEIAGGSFSPAIPMQVGATAFQASSLVNLPSVAMPGTTALAAPQMQALMQAGPSAGGQAAGGVSVILVDNRGQAEAAAMRERSLGKTVVIREVLDDLSQGEGSSIGRAMRVLQR